VAVAIFTDSEPEKLPPLGLMVGVATTSATVNVKDVVLVTPPPLEVTVIGKFPAGVDPLVLIFNNVEQVGLQEANEKEPTAPEGKPETAKETDCGLPDSRIMSIGLPTDAPGLTDRLPEFEIEKLNPIVEPTVTLSPLGAIGISEADEGSVIRMINRTRQSIAGFGRLAESHGRHPGKNGVLSIDCSLQPETP
jgi:hypothetical protein